MIGFALLCLAVGILLTIVGFLFLNHLAQFSERTIEDVPEVLRPTNPEIEQSLFDPAVDEALRRLRVPVNFRRKQRIRLDLAAQCYRCKFHHVHLCLQWLNTEWHDMHRLNSMDEYTEDALENLDLARETGKRFFKRAALVMAKLWLLRILMRLDKLRLLPTPRISALRKFAGVDMLKLYEQFKAATAEFARTYGDDESERLKALL
jgi:hypothetical protein